MAYKHTVEVKEVGDNYSVLYREPYGTNVRKEIDYDTAMLILGAIEQGREEAKYSIRRAMGCV